MATVTYGEISPRVGVMAVLRLLEVAQPRMVMQRFGQITSLPKKRGDTVKWTRYERFHAAMAKLSEGVPPTAQPMRKRDYVATLAQYGAITKITDKVEDLHEDNVLDVAVQLCGDQLAETEERLTIEMVKGSANRYYASGVAGRDSVAAAITRGDFRWVERGFARGNVKRLNRLISPSPDANTYGIDASYFAICHTDLAADIRTCSGFIPVAQYGDPAQAVEGEIGAVEAFRVITSNLVEPYLKEGADTTTMLSDGDIPGGTVKADVYPVICIGQDAYGVVRLQGVKAAHVTVLQPNVPRFGDELGQQGSVGWKMWWAGAILFEDACAVLEVACKANPT